MQGVRHVQVYDVARTAHLERIHRSGEATTVLYRDRRYDFDTDLAAEVGARRVGTWGAFWYALKHDIDVLEVAEPLLVRAAPRSCAAILGARLRARARRHSLLVVAYAIENKDPIEGVETLRLRARLKLRLQRVFVPGVWKSLDRVAFGTSQAQELSRRLLGSTHARQRLIPALPVAEPGVGTAPRGPEVAFLGELSSRKGFPLLVEAWPLVRTLVPDARLTILGKGPGEPDARDLAAADERVRAEIDPSRDRIFEVLEQAKVFALPSQPRPRWREQVGLPIVEALGRGCLIVTTAETGLAAWLEQHGHDVVPGGGDADRLALAIVAGLRSERTPGDVLADLPAVDGRAAAERWILTGAPSE